MLMNEGCDEGSMNNSWNTTEIVMTHSKCANNYYYKYIHKYTTGTIYYLLKKLQCQGQWKRFLKRALGSFMLTNMTSLAILPNKINYTRHIQTSV